jgi:hypothetical protein
MLGGLLAVLGGWGAIWYQFRVTSERRMKELLADRKIEANAQAYSIIKEIQGHLLQSDTQTTHQQILDKEEWFFKTRLFLPGRFPEKWLSMRDDVRRLGFWEESSSRTPEEMAELLTQIDSTVKDAILEIYNDMDLKPIDFSPAATD